MPRKTVPVVLSEPELTRLQEWLRAGSTPQQVVWRCRIILAAAQGRQDRAIAHDLKISRTTAALWRQRVRAQGIGCVWEIAPGRGRKARHDPKKIAAAITATLHERPAGATHWSTRTLARSQGLSKSTIHRLWQEQALRPHQRQTFKLSRDPRFLEKLTDVVGVRRRSLDREVCGAGPRPARGQARADQLAVRDDEKVRPRGLRSLPGAAAARGRRTAAQTRVGSAASEFRLRPILRPRTQASRRDRERGGRGISLHR